jgi:integrase
MFTSCHFCHLATTLCHIVVATCRLLWLSWPAILSRRKKNTRTLSHGVFYKPSLKPYSEFDALKIWNKACKSVNVKDATPRDIRHEAITDNMKRAGLNDAIVGNVAGHSDPRTTKRYTHFSVEETKMPLGAYQAKCSRTKWLKNEGA